MIMRADAKKAASSVPAVDFYGDASAWPISELVHSEKLIDRSELHGWRIRPHRHNDLMQLFLVLDGEGSARLDSEWHQVAAPSLIIVPERAVHEFKWVEGSDGFALSIRSHLIATMSQRIESLSAAFSTPSILDVSEWSSFLSGLFETIHDESQESRLFKDVSLDALVRVLGIWLARNVAAQSPANSPSGRAAKHHSRFTRLVDKHHKSQWSVPDYASALGVTPSHLNAVCQKVSNKSALQIIHDRLVLAARRELAYTERNVAGVAHDLGFADPSYFTRFFKRETGMTPGAYRRRSGTING
jgi:AraC family transcriptional activator of pobA